MGGKEGGLCPLDFLWTSEVPQRNADIIIDSGVYLKFVTRHVTKYYYIQMAAICCRRPHCQDLKRNVRSWKDNNQSCTCFLTLFPNKDSSSKLSVAELAGRFKGHILPMPAAHDEVRSVKRSFIIPLHRFALSFFFCLVFAVTLSTKTSMFAEVSHPER